jgi:hypothetical protein
VRLSQFKFDKRKLDSIFKPTYVTSSSPRDDDDDNDEVDDYHHHHYHPTVTHVARNKSLPQFTFDP